MGAHCVAVGCAGLLNTAAQNLSFADCGEAVATLGKAAELRATLFNAAFTVTNSSVTHQQLSAQLAAVLQQLTGLSSAAAGLGYRCCLLKRSARHHRASGI